MSTYVPIQAITLSAAASSVDFTGIPATFTDLVLVSSFIQNTGSAQQAQIRFNSDTATNYSLTYLDGSGSAAASGRVTNATAFALYYVASTGVSTPITSIAHIMNYANITTSKTALVRAGSSANPVSAYVGLWRKTPEAINKITIFADQGGNFQSGTTFTLYGIGSGTTKASGGEIYVSGGFAYHVFKQSGQFTPSQSLSVDYLVIAGGGGGGGGGNSVGAGGGAGGYRSATTQSLTAQTYTVLVGAGGNAGNENWGGNGTNSSFNGLVSSGGGGGAAAGGNGVTRQGLSGGSGGGSNGWDASGSSAGGVGNTPSTSPSQGNNGGSYTGTGGNRAGAGGGGAGAVGANASGGNSGAGGIGSNAHSTWATATNTGVSGYYAGGGGGSGDVGQTSAGGTGGGGAGSYVIANSANGTANTGGGGGGAGGNTSTGRFGGSGIVIVRYAV